MLENFTDSEPCIKISFQYPSPKMCLKSTHRWRIEIQNLVSVIRCCSDFEWCFSLEKNENTYGSWIFHGRSFRKTLSCYSDRMCNSEANRYASRKRDSCNISNILWRSSRFEFLPFGRQGLINLDYWLTVFHLQYWTSSIFWILRPSERNSFAFTKKICLF